MTIALIDMTTPAPYPEIRLPIARLALAEIAACVVLAGLFAGAVSPFDASALPSVAIGLGVMLFGVACGLAPLLLLRPRAAGMWAMPVLFAGMVRMLAGLSAGLWAWFAFEPHRIGFWGAILVTGVAALIAEVVAVMPTLRGDALHNHHTESTQGEPSPA